MWLYQNNFQNILNLSVKKTRSIKYYMIMICFSISEQTIQIKKITVINPFLKSLQTTIMVQYFLKKKKNPNGCGSCGFKAADI